MSKKSKIRFSPRFSAGQRQGSDIFLV